MSDESRHRVGVVVFVETDGVDFADAAYVAETLVRKGLVGDGMGRLPTTLTQTRGEQTWTADVVDVRELSRAASNAFIGVQVAMKAWREQGL